MTGDLTTTVVERGSVTREPYPPNVTIALLQGDPHGPALD